MERHDARDFTYIIQTGYLFTGITLEDKASSAAVLASATVCTGRRAHSLQALLLAHEFHYMLLSARAGAR
eukprot:scaffold12241_cov22-Tisochrysis_lutea.AAC.1